MRIPYAFHLTSTGAFEITENEAEVVQMIFDYYLAGAGLGKVIDLLYGKQISSPTGKAKWTRAAVDHLLSNSKYIAIVGLECYMSVQFENLPAAILTMTKQVHREKRLDMSPLL